MTEMFVGVLGRWAGTLYDPEHAIGRTAGDFVYGRALTGTHYGRSMRIAVVDHFLGAWGRREEGMQPSANCRGT